jgi:tRNA pseudouridine38-40 synthase
MKCIVTYDGKNYAGWQIQDNHPSVQEAIEKSLQKIHNGEYIKIYGASRTDSGVHAKGQVFHFDTEIPLEGKRWKLAINTYLENDIYVSHVERVDEDFHSRYSVTKKEI